MVVIKINKFIGVPSKFFPETHEIKKGYWKIGDGYYHITDFVLGLEQKEVYNVNENALSYIFINGDVYECLYFPVSHIKHVDSGIVSEADFVGVFRYLSELDNIKKSGIVAFASALSAYYYYDGAKIHWTQEKYQLIREKFHENQSEQA